MIKDVNILTVRKRRMCGIPKHKRPQLTGSIYLPAGNVGKRFVLMSIQYWKKVKKERSTLNALIKLVDKEAKRRS